MHVTRPDKIVLLGFLSHFPVAGVAWQTLHYLLGFQRLGYEVYYVEAHGCTPSKLMQTETDDGPARAAAYIADLMRRFDLDGRWAYHAIYEGRCFGLSETQLKDLYGSAALLLNLHGSHLPTPELTATNRLVYLGTDPVDIEIDVFNGKQEAIDYLKPHCAFFSYGENLGAPDCLVPRPEPFQFHRTRQPVILDFWESYGAGEATTFTTIGNWRQPWREVRFQGQVYTWSKHFEFRKFLALPRRVSQPFELALSSYEESDQRQLEAQGWRVRPALPLSQDLDIYRRYIAESRGEFTVAKDQNVRLRSGWFSDRAATYLAAGRPVITQETGFSNVYPTGEGLFAFSTLDEIVAAVETINADYERHRRAAWTIARECFSHEVVLGRMLRDLGMPFKKSEIRNPKSEIDERLLTSAACIPTPAFTRSAGFPACGFTGLSSPVDQKLATGKSPEPAGWKACATSGLADGANLPAPLALPPTLVIVPTSRWPTRLPEETIQTASALPPPVVERGCPQPQQPNCAKNPQNLQRSSRNQRTADDDVRAPSGKRASIIIVTFNGLPFTKLCLTSLLAHGWPAGDELIVVDNASTDGTPEYLRELARLNPFVHVILNERNLGFAAANNQGLTRATGDVLILLNNDTLPPPHWREGLARWLEDPGIGLVGPVTNRTCNEAQIDAPYRTLGEMEQFAHDYTRTRRGEGNDIRMLAMFCLALRREVFQKVGALDEQFEVGMFEDDDYARRVRQAGYRIVCAEDVFVHHFGQASFGELCATGEYDRVLEANRRRFETKWGIVWEPHGRRITEEYQQLRQRIRETVGARLPAGATVLVVSKGDDELLQFDGRRGWHFPQAEDGRYANLYPADSAEAIAHLEALRAKGAGYLVIPKPGLWWLEHYGGFKNHLEQRHRLAAREEETCLIFDLGGGNGQ